MTTLDLGPQLPKVLSASLPWQDELGLWVNFEIEYNGLCQATVETQVSVAIVRGCWASDEEVSNFLNPNFQVMLNLVKYQMQVEWLSGGQRLDGS